MLAFTPPTLAEIHMSIITICRAFHERQPQTKNVRWPGIEPGSIAWKATMLAFTPPTLAERYHWKKTIYTALWNQNVISVIISSYYDSHITVSMIY